LSGNACSTPALTAEPQLLIPNTTKFTFSSESKGNNKFCDLIMSLTYAIAADASLLDAAEKWTKCSIEIAM